MLGLVDFGRSVQAYTIVANAAREGVRAAIVPGNNDTAVITAVESAAPPLAIPPTAITISRNTGSITVSVTATIAPVTPLLARFVGGAITVIGAATQPVQ